MVRGFRLPGVPVDGHDSTPLAAPAELPPDGRPLVVLAMTDTCRGMKSCGAKRRVPFDFRL